MRKKSYGHGITFIDIDETLFHTTAKINVLKNDKILKKLNNQEFNEYKLNDGESFDFAEFKDAVLFMKTSVPIKKTIARVKNMISRIKSHKTKSRIILLTARSDFPRKDIFLKTFLNQDIDITNKEIIYIERAGNIPHLTIAKKKRMIIEKYLRQGIYRRCRLLDDCKHNLKEFLLLEKDLSPTIIDNIRKTHNLPDNQKTISFYAFHVKNDGTLERITNE